MIKSLPQYKTDFLMYCEVEKGLLQTTTRNYDRFLNKFFQWLAKNSLSSLKPPELTEEHIWKYRIWLSRLPNAVRKNTNGLSTSSQARYLIALRTFLSFLHEKNIPALATEKIKLPKEQERHIKFLSLEQVKKLLESPDITTTGFRDKAILETLFSTGLRVSELLLLNRKYLDGSRGRKDFEMSVVGKGNHSRTVYFSERALSAIHNYLNKRNDSDNALFVRFKGPRSTSLRLTSRAVEFILEKYSKKSGIPFIATPHTMRHSFATDLLNEGVDLRMVQEFLGHRNIATTQVYTHVTNRRLRDIHRQFHGGRKLQEKSS